MIEELQYNPIFGSIDVSEVTHGSHVHT